MDKDDFLQWKDSQATQWVLRHLKAAAERVDGGIKARLIASFAAAPEQWAGLQADAAHSAGYVTAIREMIDLDFEDVNEESNERSD